MMNPDSQTGKVAGESPPGSGFPHHSSDVIVDRVCPTKRAGAIVANAWAQIGDIRIRFKILNGPYGLFVVPPASIYKTKSGRTRYAPHVWLDPNLHQQVAEAVLEAYEIRLAEDGRRTPGGSPNSGGLRSSSGVVRTAPASRRKCREGPTRVPQSLKSVSNPDYPWRRRRAIMGVGVRMGGAR